MRRLALCAARSAMVQPGGAIHLVLTDINIPGSDGYALARHRRAQLVASEQFIEKPFSAERRCLTIRLALQPNGPGLPATTGQRTTENA